MWAFKDDIGSFDDHVRVIWGHLGVIWGSFGSLVKVIMGHLIVIWGKFKCHLEGIWGSCRYWSLRCVKNKHVWENEVWQHDAHQRTQVCCRQATFHEYIYIYKDVYIYWCVKSEIIKMKRKESTWRKNIMKYRWIISYFLSVTSYISHFVIQICSHETTLSHPSKIIYFGLCIYVKMFNENTHVQY